MPNLCCVKTCVSHSCKQKSLPYVSFHKFPFEKNQKQAWSEFIRRHDPTYVHCKSHVLCSAHFADSDFIIPNDDQRQNEKKGNKLLRSRLKKEAVPIYFPSIMGEEVVDEDTNLLLWLFPKSAPQEIADIGMDACLPCFESSLVHEEMEHCCTYIDERRIEEDLLCSDTSLVTTTTTDGEFPSDSTDIADNVGLEHRCPGIPELSESHDMVNKKDERQLSETSQSSQSLTFQQPSMSSKNNKPEQSVGQCQTTSICKVSQCHLSTLERESLLIRQNPKAMKDFMSKLFRMGQQLDLQKYHNEKDIFKTDTYVYRPLIHHYIGVLLHLHHYGKLNGNPWICFCNSDGLTTSGPTHHCKILCGKEIASLWGKIKNNKQEMTYDKFARAIRKSRDSGNFEKQEGSHGRGKGAKKGIIRFSVKAIREFLFAFNWPM